MIPSFCYRMQKRIANDINEMIRGLALMVVHIACVADRTAISVFGSHGTNLHFPPIAFWPGCSDPTNLQKETCRSEVVLLILLMGACHVGKM
jgi:hypothetical protein